ncbi:MAG: hypothetical protein WBZ48_08830 [Bacteroidota bacterium]
MRVVPPDGPEFPLKSSGTGKPSTGLRPEGSLTSSHRFVERQRGTSPPLSFRAWYVQSDTTWLFRACKIVDG